MRIGIVLAKPPGYTETFFMAKIIGLQAKGFTVSLYCQENENNFNLCPVNVRPPLTSNPFLQIFYTFLTYLKLSGSLKAVRNYIRLEKKEGTPLSKILKRVYLNAHILQAETDWLHFGFATMALERELLAEAIGAKMAVSFRGFDIDVYPLKHPACYKLLWQKVDKVHSISQYLLKKAFTLGLPQDKPAEIISPAVDLKKFSGIPTTSGENSSLKIITVARLHWIKGIDLLIATAENLRKRNIDFEWIIAGAGDKKEEERYRYHVYEKKLEKHVIFLGALSHAETIQKINDADIYVQTSFSEGFCNAVLEAQALGKTCIAFAVGGIPENILDGTTGWLVQNISTEEMANKLIEVAGLPIEDLKKISEAAVERVGTKFNIEEQQRKFQRFYS